MMSKFYVITTIINCWKCCAYSEQFSISMFEDKINLVLYVFFYTNVIIIALILTDSVLEYDSDSGLESKIIVTIYMM